MTDGLKMFDWMCFESLEYEQNFVSNVFSLLDDDFTFELTFSSSYHVAYSIFSMKRGLDTQ